MQRMRLTTILAAFIGLAGVVACGGAATPPDHPSLPVSSAPSPSAAQCVDGYIRDVFNRGDIAATDRYFDERAVDHAPWPGHPATRAGFKAGLTELRRAFPDLEVTVQRKLIDGDLVAVHMTIRGTHRGAFMGAPPTGKRIEIEAIDIVRIAGGKVAEHWGVLDEAKMGQQLGLTP